eukprot:6186477-Pleurochrysis_carterae.AAC.4
MLRSSAHGASCSVDKAEDASSFHTVALSDGALAFPDVKSSTVAPPGVRGLVGLFSAPVALFPAGRADTQSALQSDSLLITARSGRWLPSALGHIAAAQRLSSASARAGTPALLTAEAWSCPQASVSTPHSVSSAPCRHGSGTSAQTSRTHASMAGSAASAAQSLRNAEGSTDASDNRSCAQHSRSSADGEDACAGAFRPACSAGLPAAAPPATAAVLRLALSGLRRVLASARASARASPCAQQVERIAESCARSLPIVRCASAHCASVGAPPEASSSSSARERAALAACSAAPTRACRGSGR